MIEKERIDLPQHIDKGRLVTLKYLGNLRQINISDRINAGATIKPISKEEFLVVSTGEIRKVSHHAKDRTENIRNLEKTMRNLRDRINANITADNIKKTRFITLTYEENMQDSKRLYTDFRDFNKRFQRYINNQYHLSYEYLVCVEAQGRGAFHLHMIVIFSNAPPYLENAIVAEIWRHGFVSVKALDNNIDNIGAYLTAYLTDLDIETALKTMPISEIKEIQQVHTEQGESKHIVKGARLKLLPAGMNIYRCSRGFKVPETKKMYYSDALQEMVETGFTKVHESAIKITDTERSFTNTYISQTYKQLINPNFRCNDSTKTN